jgi:hypothetical protein
MRQWIIKTFQKRKAVRIYLVMPDKRLKEYWVIPQGNFVKIKGVGDFVINLEGAHLSSKNVPTFIYRADKLEPFDLQGGKESLMTSKEIQTALDANIASEIFNASKGSAISQDVVIICLVVIVAVAGAWYMLDTKLTAIMEALQVLGVL